MVPRGRVMSGTATVSGAASSREENGPAQSLPWTVRRLIDRLAASGEKPVLASVRGDEVQLLCAGELASRSLQLAAGLLGAGVARGEPVLLLGENSFEWVIARLALGAMGAVPVAIDPLTPKAEIGEILVATGARFVFTAAAHLASFKDPTLGRQPKICVMGDTPPQGDAAVIGLRSLMSVPSQALPEIDPAWPAMMVLTSGTTGKPKRFLLNSRQIWANIAALQASGLVTAQDRVFLPLPLHHAYPLVVGLLTSLETGALVIFPESTSGHAIVQALRSSHATIMVGVPRLYSALLTALEAAVAARGRIFQALYHAILAGCIRLRRGTGWSPGRLLFRGMRARVGSDLRILVSGGAKIDLETVLTLEGLGWHVRSGYGLAETASVFTGNTPGSERLGSEGRPLGQGRIRIGHPAEDGSGEVELRGACVFEGYLENPEPNASAFTPDGWFRTGDLGYLDKDGFLYITGRSKELIVLGGGKKVFPEEVERIYGASRFIGELAVLERSGGLVALVVPNLAAIRNTGVASPENAVRVALAGLAQRLPSYARIAGFALTRQPLPRTRLGKYRRFLLPGLYERALAHAEPPESTPLSPEDQALLAEPTAAALWSLLTKRFKQARLTPDSSLQLDLGLDSLAWMALALEIENRLAIRLDDAAVDRSLTVRDLLREAAAAGKDEPAPAEQNLLDSRWLKPRGPSLRAAGAVIHLVNRLVMRLAFGLRVEGAENLPSTGPCIIAANHVSFLDPAAMAAALPWRMLPRVHWAADRIMLFSNPLSRFVCRAMCIFPVDQRSPASVLTSAITVLMQGHMLVWFPEGWRSPTKTMLPFQPGIGRVLEETGASVVPTYVDGTFESLPRGQNLPHFARITISFGPAISVATLRGNRPAGDYQAIANALKERIETLSRKINVESIRE
jgi:long-chain acyl-CoA synthetase